MNQDTPLIVDLLIKSKKWSWLTEDLISKMVYAIEHGREIDLAEIQIEPIPVEISDFAYTQFKNFCKEIAQKSNHQILLWVNQLIREGHGAYFSQVLGLTELPSQYGFTSVELDISAGAENPQLYAMQQELIDAKGSEIAMLSIAQCETIKTHFSTLAQKDATTLKAEYANWDSIAKIYDVADTQFKNFCEEIARKSNHQILLWVNQLIREGYGAYFSRVLDLTKLPSQHGFTSVKLDLSAGAENPQLYALQQERIDAKDSEIAMLSIAQCKTIKMHFSALAQKDATTLKVARANWDSIAKIYEVLHCIALLLKSHSKDLIISSKPTQQPVNFYRLNSSQTVYYLKQQVEQNDTNTSSNATIPSSSPTLSHKESSQ